MFPYGHGEKSVFLIERFMKLKVEEAVAIRWHMGGFDDAARGGCFAIVGGLRRSTLWPSSSTLLTWRQRTSWSTAPAR